MGGALYRVNFGTGKMELIDESRGDKNDLKPGTILQLNGYDCGEYLITQNLGIDPRWENYGANYQTIYLLTGESSTHQAHSLKWLRDKKDNRIAVYITDRVLSPEEMKDALDRAAQVKAENDEKARLVEEARELETRELPSRYPFLKRLKDGKESCEVVGAANIRIELKKAFPGVKFSVRTEHRGSSSINIGWTDGPTTEQVKTVTDKYQEGDFNGMEDIYEYNDAIFPRIFGGARYVFENRHESPALILWAAKELGYDLPSGECDNHGNLPGLDYEESRRIYRQARTMAVETEKPTEECAEVITGTAATIRKNEEKGGIEVIFPEKPAANVIERLKALGFRWSRFQGLWWRKYDADVMAQVAAIV